MRIILSADTVRYPLTGTGRYAWELASALNRHEAISDLRFSIGTAVSDRLPSPDEQAEARLGRLERGLRQIPGAVELAGRWRRRRRGQALRPYTGYLYHGTSFYLPPVAGPAVVTIHDLSIFKWPQHHPPERVRFMRGEIAHALAHADHLITDSEFTRREVAEFFNWPLGRITAVPLASAPDFVPRAPEAIAPLLVDWALQPDGYTLYLGTIEPRKNLGVLLAAYQNLPVSLRQRFPLVLAGHSGWKSDAILADIGRAEREGWARYLGYLPEQALAPLVAGARLFLFPSIYEGFGLPVLEAMAAGVPVICSDAASLPEVAGDAAVCCPPEDGDAWRDALARGLEDADWRELAVARGLTRAASFSWQRTADETVRVYRALYGG